MMLQVLMFAAWGRTPRTALTSKLLVHQKPCLLPCLNSPARLQGGAALRFCCPVAGVRAVLGPILEHLLRGLPSGDSTSSLKCCSLNVTGA